MQNEEMARGYVERSRGAWYGLAVGDALGAPHEFNSEETLRSLPTVLEMTAGGPWRKGEWTDDTALMLATARAYTSDEFMPGRVAMAMIDWLEEKPKDVGLTTLRAIQLLLHGAATCRTAGALVLKEHPEAAGNGSLMRALPTSLVWPAGSPRLVEESKVLSRITHADPRCVDACVAFNNVVAALIVGATVREALGVAHVGVDEPRVLEIVERAVRREPAMYVNADGAGYVLLALDRAFTTLRDCDTFEGGIDGIVRKGGDADTNAAIAGALLGARFGYSSIPERWIHPLRFKRLLEKTFTMIIAHRDGQKTMATL